jgi:hypothetical protein
MDQTITKRRARELLRAKNDAELARLFDISDAAVSQWGEDKPIPPLRQLQIAARQVRPLRRRSHH